MHQDIAGFGEPGGSIVREQGSLRTCSLYYLNDFKNLGSLFDYGALLIKNVGEAHFALKGIPRAQCDPPTMKTIKPSLILDGGIDNGIPVIELPFCCTEEIGPSDC